MTLKDLIPPIPESWDLPPRVVVIEGKPLSTRQFSQWKEMLENARLGKPTAAQIDSKKRKADRYNTRRREEYALLKLGESQVSAATLERGVWGES